MATKTNVGGKYTNRKVTEEEDAEIKELAQKNKKGYLWAKDRYFAAKGEQDIKEEIKQPSKEKGAPRKSMTIEQAKLGITMVISLPEAKSMGFTGKEPTSEAIRVIREKLGLKQRLRA